MKKQKETANYILIEGRTQSGQPFRPSNWAERFSDKMCMIDSRQIHRHSPLLRPIIQNGIKCLLIDTRLEKSQPQLYQFVMQFAKINKLVVNPYRQEGS